MTTFSEFITGRRKELGYTMRQFAITKGYDTAYVSRLESGLLSAPADQQKVKALAKALELKPSTEEWVEFFDLVAASRNELPDDLKKDPAISRVMPSIYRTLRSENPTKLELQELFDSIMTERLQD